MLPCYNRGCGQLFDPEKNEDDSCRHHPGAPFFHDAYKGWSCCNKKSVDFTEFLSIKGCTLSKHSNVKPAEPEKPSKNEEIDNNEVIEVREPIREPLQRPPIETPMIALKATVAPTLKDAIDSLIIGPTKEKETLVSGEIPVGTTCKNNGCTYAYSGNASDLGECIYHPGVPIFHEGMKYWSCCQKKTTDFAVFMAQKGCAYGDHKWIKENEDKKVVQCRYDWHQTASSVIVSIYAKKYHYAESIIKINPVRLYVVLVFPEQENAKFLLDIELRGIINVDKASAHMYATKLEITMPKLEPGSWPKLNFPRDKLPPPITQHSNHENNTTACHKAESDDEFDLDDIETVTKYSLNLTEINSDNSNKA